MSPKLPYPLKVGAILLVLAAAGLAGIWLAAAASPKPELWGNRDFSTIFTDRNGKLLRVTLSSDEKYRIYVPLSRIPPEMQEATLLYEDRAFWSHPGVNPLSMARAIGSMALGGRKMGGSTITMQLVRLTGGLDTTNLPGKLRQMWRAFVLERHYTKQNILEAYLNLAPYGGNVEGVGAAARIWFNKDADFLTVPEILALATVPQNPAARNPLAARGKALSEARLRLNELWRDAHPDTAEDFFSQAPLRVYGPAFLPFEAPHAVNGLLAESGPAPETRDFASPVRTSLDLSKQKLLEQCVARAVGRGKIWGMENASALLLDWRTGEIVSLVGSADFYKANIQGQVDGTNARRSPGSTLKPFIYGLALAQGLIHPQTVLMDTPRVFHGYMPENADNAFQGPLSARLALLGSRNIPAIALANQLKHPDLYNFLREAGVNFTEDSEHYGLALVLGGAEVTMRELAALYAMLPNRGVWQKPVLHANEKNPGQALLMPEAAFVAMDMLGSPSPYGFDRTITYWKTGTSNGQRDAWTAGIFGPYVLVVWVGRFDGSMNPGFTGLHAAAPLFFDIIQAVSSFERLNDEPRGNLDYLNLTRINVCAATGDVNIKLCSGRPGFSSGTVETWFIPGVSPIKPSGILREIILDRATGLRQCRDIPGRTERVVWEFWPADLRHLFNQAGVHKPSAPPYLPECRSDGFLPGKGPEIMSPHPGVTYTRSLSAPNRIPLLANTDSDVESVFWFAGNKFLGRTTPEVPILWEPPPGMTELRVVDDLGRSGQLKVQVETVP